MRAIIICQLLIGLIFGCVGEEDIFAYEYDPERLCLVDPDSPIKIGTREVRKEPKDPPIALLPTTCSVNEERRLVSFQSYYTKDFVDCYHVWEEVVYWKEIPGKRAFST